METARIALLPIACAVLATVATVPALARSNEEALLRLAPSARMEQRCNAKAMGTIGRERKGMRPDELVAYAFADTKLKDGLILAPGAAVRSRGKWYRLSYSCQTADNGTQVTTFTYTLGSEVPRDQWSQHYLVPP
ncbi:hypothetical protein GCM10007301_11520 [Azorhizobium oxalatiphilum]|uniref:DUF930 domain-containing protein n=1 Tax=Azorhizobium oxalatiphilum TaxID=980631 RepID=A0A917BP52_9HYPH|nr:DUF930 domain-containing protein [Azorhizobium oxalatiphilum]GGF53759.1 hypothetical protein GCM10007301_11520 [Azorhizobium oxalatiphilum]